MKKRRVYKTPSSKGTARRSIPASAVHRDEQPANHETEHPMITLQRQLGNSRVARLMGAQSTDSLQRKPKAATQTITFGPDEGATIVGHRPDQRSSVIDTFFSQFGTKLLATSASFNGALTNFSDTMRFPADKKAEPDFQEVFLDMLGDVVKEGFEKVTDALTEDIPGIGAAKALVGALHAEVARAQQVAAQLNIRDFLVQTRQSFNDAISARIDAFTKGAAAGLGQAQTQWRSTNTPEEELAITDPMNKFLAQPTPKSGEFQKEIVSAYIRSQHGRNEDGALGLSIRNLGRIEVKYDDDGKFEEATVQLASGSGSDQVADQINKLYGSPIDLRSLHTEIAVAVYGDGIAGGRTYYYVLHSPPDYEPHAPMGDFAMNSYRKIPGNSLVVPRVKG